MVTKEKDKIKEEKCKHTEGGYCRTCGEIVYTSEQATADFKKRIDDKLNLKEEALKNLQQDYLNIQGKERLLEINRLRAVIDNLEELKQMLVEK
jgi:cyanate lyase